MIVPESSPLHNFSLSQKEQSRGEVERLFDLYKAQHEDPIDAYIKRTKERNERAKQRETPMYAGGGEGKEERKTNYSDSELMALTASSDPQGSSETQKNLKTISIRNAQGVTNAVGGDIAAAARTFQTIPVPSGGIGLLLLVNLLILFAVVPLRDSNGDMRTVGGKPITRLDLLVGSLYGATYLQGQQDLQAPNPYGITMSDIAGAL